MIVYTKNEKILINNLITKSPRLPLSLCLIPIYRLDVYIYMFFNLIIEIDFLIFRIFRFLVCYSLSPLAVSHHDYLYISPPLSLSLLYISYPLHDSMLSTTSYKVLFRNKTYQVFFPDQFFQVYSQTAAGHPENARPSSAVSHHDDLYHFCLIPICLSIVHRHLPVLVIAPT